MPGDPQDSSRAQARRALARRVDRGRDHDDEDGEIGKSDVRRGRAEIDRELRLVLLVEEEERNRKREEERSGGVAVDEIAQGSHSDA